MSMYGQIGITRVNKTPKHWQKDYYIRPYTQKEIEKLKLEKEKLFREFENLPIELTDEEYFLEQRILDEKLNELLDKEDELRKAND